ncbi:hypothetical protein [Actinospica robiniae]|uniref:hypothetical protein n=1 Tax=Actinospica robiniae TaxID=304901 RepID=UPI0003F749DE|nr:hypothetical protein [Actinospica robiniae]
MELLRSVERYLHNLPGADLGAARAIARVRTTGALYPQIKTNYDPSSSARSSIASVRPMTAASKHLLLPSQEGIVDAMLGSAGVIVRC